MLRPLKRVFAKHARAGVAQDGAQAGLARVRRLDDSRLSLATRMLRTPDEDGMWAEDAASHSSEIGLKQTPVSAVLPTDAYQLQPVEMPNVPAEERLAAVRWRVKDLINYPLDEAVIELIEMPPHANPGNAPIAYAVIARRNEVQRQVAAMGEADLRMDVIDIPEMCIRNIAVLLPQDEYGVAFLHFAEDCAYLTITRQGVLHLMRRIETGREKLHSAAGDEFALQERLGSIALEVQRSLDYYESHYDCRPITEIILGPGTDLDALPESLAQHLDLTVSRISLNDLFVMEDELSPEEQNACLLAVGAALRQDEVAPLAVAS